MKLLADEQVPLIFVNKLRLLGFDLIEVKKIPELQAQDDVTMVLLYAKRRKRILLSADNMEDRDTRSRMYENLRTTKRGKVLTIRGGPEQGWARFVGKFIYHLDTWSEFFEADHGWFVIGDLKPDTARGRRPSEVPRKKKTVVRQGERYVAAKDAVAAGPVNPRLARPRAKQPPAGARLL